MRNSITCEWSIRTKLLEEHSYSRVCDGESGAERGLQGLAVSGTDTEPDLGTTCNKNNTGMIQQTLLQVACEFPI